MHAGRSSERRKRRQHRTSGARFEWPRCDSRSSEDHARGWPVSAEQIRRGTNARACRIRDSLSVSRESDRNDSRLHRGWSPTASDRRLVTTTKVRQVHSLDPAKHGRKRQFSLRVLRCWLCGVCSNVGFVEILRASTHNDEAMKEAAHSNLVLLGRVGTVKDKRA